jgi:glucosylceramidase
VSSIAQYLPQLAQYFLRFLQAYQQDGIDIYAVSMQNEPLNSTTAYPSASVPVDVEAGFIANDLGPVLAGAGFGTVKILGYDHNWDNTSYAESLLASAAAPYLAGTAFHCYAGDVGAQSTVHDAYPDKDIWFTECSGTVGSDFAGDLVWNTENLLIGATRNWARGITLWNIALDQDSGPTNGGCMGCRGVVTIDTRTAPATITRNVEYYALGQLSRFAPEVRGASIEFVCERRHRGRRIPESRRIDRAAGVESRGNNAGLLGGLAQHAFRLQPARAVGGDLYV